MKREYFLLFLCLMILLYLFIAILFIINFIFHYIKISKMPDIILLQI